MAGRGAARNPHRLLSAGQWPDSLSSGASGLMGRPASVLIRGHEPQTGRSPQQRESRREGTGLSSPLTSALSAWPAGLGLRGRWHCEPRRFQGRVSQGRGLEAQNPDPGEQRGGHGVACSWGTWPAPTRLCCSPGARPWSGHCGRRPLPHPLGSSAGRRGALAAEAGPGSSHMPPAFRAAAPRRDTCGWNSGHSGDRCLMACLWADAMCWKPSGCPRMRWSVGGGRDRWLAGWSPPAHLRPAHQPTILGGRPDGKDRWRGLRTLTRPASAIPPRPAQLCCSPLSQSPPATRLQPQAVRI